MREEIKFLDKRKENIKMNGAIRNEFHRLIFFDDELSL